MNKFVQDSLIIVLIVILGLAANGRMKVESKATEKGTEWYKQSAYPIRMDNIKREFASAGYNDDHSAYNLAKAKRDSLCKKIEQDLRSQGTEAEVQIPSWWIYHDDNGKGEVNGIETPDPIVKIYN